MTALTAELLKQKAARHPPQSLPAAEEASCIFREKSPKR